MKLDCKQSLFCSRIRGEKLSEYDIQETSRAREQRGRATHVLRFPPVDSRETARSLNETSVVEWLAGGGWSMKGIWFKKIRITAITIYYGRKRQKGQRKAQGIRMLFKIAEGSQGLRESNLEVIDNIFEDNLGIILPRRRSFGSSRNLYSPPSRWYRSVKHLFPLLDG